jgi:hypothetical protein
LVAFFVELAAAMIVASTIVPAFSRRRILLGKCDLITARSVPGRRITSGKWGISGTSVGGDGQNPSPPTDRLRKSEKNQKPRTFSSATEVQALPLTSLKARSRT